MERRWLRAQIYALDAIMGAIIFTITLSVIFFYWWAMGPMLYDQREDMKAEAVRAAGMLMTSGNPENWDELVNPNDYSTFGDVRQVGLMRDMNTNEISKEKMGNLTEMIGYNTIVGPPALGPGSPDYDFYYKVRELLGISYHFNITIVDVDVSSGEERERIIAKAGVCPRPDTPATGCSCTVNDAYCVCRLMNVVTVERNIIYDDGAGKKPVILRLQLWSTA
ncbi:MAG: hypothetical protein QXP42_00735 [Candidatus Micrarchaeia archaeon]